MWDRQTDTQRYARCARCHDLLIFFFTVSGVLYLCSIMCSLGSWQIGIELNWIDQVWRSHSLPDCNDKLSVQGSLYKAYSITLAFLLFFCLHILSCSFTLQILNSFPKAMLTIATTKKRGLSNLHNILIWMSISQCILI